MAANGKEIFTGKRRTKGQRAGGSPGTNSHRTASKNFPDTLFLTGGHTYIGWRRKSNDQSNGRVGCNLTTASANIIACRSGDSTRFPYQSGPGSNPGVDAYFPSKRSLPPLVTNPLNSHDRCNLREIIRLWMALERTTLKPKLNLREKLWPRARITFSWCDS